MRSDPASNRRTFLLLGLLGAAVGFLGVSAVTLFPVSAVAPVDLTQFDTDTYPAIDVSHRFPAVVSAAEDVQLEFFLACGYVSIGARCSFQTTLFVGYGGDFAAVPLQKVNRDSLTALVAEVAPAGIGGGRLEYYLEVHDAAHDVVARYPTRGVFAPFVSEVLIEVPLTKGASVTGALLAQFPWGTGTNELGLSSGSQQLTSGPEAIGVSPSGSRLAVLDSMNHRVIAWSAATGGLSHLSTDAQLGDVAILDGGDVVVLDSIGVSMREGGPPIPRLLVYSPTGELKSTAPVYQNAPSEINPDGTVQGISGRAISPLTASGRPADRTTQRYGESQPTLEVFFRHDGQVLLADRSAGVAFRVTSDQGVGPIALFERYDDGYVLGMDIDAGLALVWFDARGMVGSYIVAPRADWADMHPTGRIASDTQGRVYVMSNDASGIEVRMFEEVGA